MGSRASLKYFLLKRLDSRMAIGESRHQAKQAIRDTTEGKVCNVSTGHIHSFGSRDTYQQQVMVFVDWVKAHHPEGNVTNIDTYADAWGSEYLQELIEKGRSASTLMTIRSALRICFSPQVAASVTLPHRKRREIARSRVPVKQDTHFQAENWPSHILFAQATGLRRAEMRDLLVCHVTAQPDGTVSVYVRNGKGGKQRDVVVLSGYEQEILAMIEGREPHEHLFAHMPKNMDIQSYRRASAQARYRQQSGGRTLPPVNKRLKATDYDEAAVQDVAASLGHSRRRTSVVLNYYLR